MRPSILHAFRILSWMGGLLATLIQGSATDGTADHPSPTPNAIFVRPEVVLRWTAGSLLPLTNPGFEQGTNGWEVGAARLLTASSGTAPAEGINFLGSRTNTVVRRTLQLPATTDRVFLGYQLLGLAADAGISVDRLDTPGPGISLPGTPHLAPGWRNYAAELTAFAGDQVRLNWTLPTGDNVVCGLDNVRLTTVPKGMEFVVWLATNTPADLTRVGWTDSPAWPLRSLPPDRRFFWRVDTVWDGQSNAGPVWRFETATRLPISQVRVDPLPAELCSGQSLTLGLQVADAYGFGGGSLNVQPTVQAFGEGIAPPTVVVTEVDLFNERMEFQNVSDQRVDVSGWSVAAVNGASGTAGLVQIVLPAGTSLAAGERFQAHLRTTQAGAWPVLRSNRAIQWRNSGRAGVLLRNASGATLDAVFHHSPLVGGLLNWPLDHASWGQWPDAPIRLQGVSSQTLQRVGHRDRNGPEDWRFASPSPGQANSGLTLPFVRGRGEVSVQSPTVGITTDAEGRFQLPALFQGPGSNVVVRVTARRNSSTVYEGRGAIGRLFETCLSLNVPVSLPESAGTVPGAFIVRLSQPLAEDTQVRMKLRAGPEEGVTVPATVQIPAGSVEATGSLSITDDTWLNGERRLWLAAEAPGLPIAEATLVIVDNESTSLRLELTDTLREGDERLGTLVIDPPPDRAVAVNLSTGEPGRLLAQSPAGSPGILTVLPGSRRTTFRMVAPQNDWIDGPKPIDLEAQCGTWDAARATVIVDDDETRQLTMELLPWGYLAEGSDPGSLRVDLGGRFPSDVPVQIHLDLPGRIALPEQVVIPGGQREIQIPIQAIDDAETNGLANVHLNARTPGWQDTTNTVTVFDNDPARFILNALPGPVAPGQTVVVHVRAETIEGINLGEVATGDGTITAIGLQNQPLPLETTLSGFSQFWVTLKTNTSPARIRYSLRGAEGTTAPILVWQEPVPDRVTEVAYDAARKRLAVAQYEGELLLVDPDSGARERIEPPVNQTEKVAILGEFLYVGAVQSNQVTRILLPSRTVAETWSVLSETGTPATEISSLLPLRDRAGSVLVAARFSDRFSDTVGELIVYDGSQPRALRHKFSFQGVGRVEIRPGREGGEAFASLNGRILRLQIGKDGVSEDRWFDAVPLHFWMHHPGALPASTTLLESGHLFPVRDFGPSGSALVGADPEDGRMAWLEDQRLALLDPLTLRIAWESPVATRPAPEYPQSPVWTGPHRWTVVSGATLLMYRDAAPDLPPGPDLSLNSEVLSRDLDTRRAWVRFQVGNPGKLPASDVRLILQSEQFRLDDPPATQVIRFQGPVETTTNSLGHVQYRLGSLGPGDQLEVTAELEAPANGNLRLDVYVGSEGRDPNPADNRTVLAERGLGRYLPLSIAEPVTPAADPTATFPSALGWTYQLHSAPTPTGPWTLHSTQIGDGQLMMIVLPLDGANVRFWKLTVVP
ncbi:MAG: lamin tail domain-containing protein [Verrucomicrobiales bacterium]|nr:lamin tail domain-containing protein [Verrucomicrobiales bacterium]